MNNNSKQRSSNSKNGNNKKRLSKYQVEQLEASFYANKKLEPERKLQLAHELGVPPRQIAIWYQNKRARWKNQNMELEYSTVSTQLETTFAQIRQLEQELHGLRMDLQKSQAEISMMNANHYVHANQQLQFYNNYIVQKPHDDELQPPPPPPPHNHHHMMTYSALMSDHYNDDDDDDDDYGDQEDLTVDHELFAFFMGTD